MSTVKNHDTYDIILSFVSCFDFKRSVKCKKNIVYIHQNINKIRNATLESKVKVTLRSWWTMTHCVMEKNIHGEYHIPVSKDAVDGPCQGNIRRHTCTTRWLPKRKDDQIIHF